MSRHTSDQRSARRASAKRVIGLTAALATVAVPAMFAGSATAQSMPGSSNPSTATVSVMGGGLTASLGNLMFSKGEDSIAYSQMDQILPSDTMLTVDDSTGSGNGWNVTTQASPFVYTGTDNMLDPQWDLPASNLSIMSVPETLKNVAGKTWQPSMSVMGGSLNNAVTLLSADMDNGEGTYTMDISAQMTVPGASRAGSYVSTLTTTIATGPTAPSAG